MTKKEPKSIDEVIDTMQDQIMDASKEIVERECRETYVSTMKNIIYCLMADLETPSQDSYYKNKLEDRYKIKYKDQARLKELFIKNFNNNFDQIYGGRNNETKRPI